MSQDEIIAGILRVEAQNDRSNWHAIPKPPLGKVRRARGATTTMTIHEWLTAPATAFVTRNEHDTIFCVYVNAGSNDEFVCVNATTQAIWLSSPLELVHTFGDADLLSLDVRGG